MQKSLSVLFLLVIFYGFNIKHLFKYIQTKASIVIILFGFYFLKIYFKTSEFLKLVEINFLILFIEEGFQNIFINVDL
jgi:hypothetical protein